MHQRVLTFVILLILGFFFIEYGASRGGGSRGGSFRSGGSRISGSRSSGSRTNSGIRSGSLGRISTSLRYSTWTRRHGYPPSFSYRYSSYSEKRLGFMSGLIIMSSFQRMKYSNHYDMSYNDISICYNEQPLYGRNITKSPWFMCPWNDPRERYCCGDEIEERCCKYFDRSSHLGALIAGVVITFIIFLMVCYFCCKKRHKRRKDSLSIEFSGDKFDNEVQYPLYPVAPTQTIGVTSSYLVPSSPSDVSPPYPLSSDTNPPYPLSSDTSPPYPVPSAQTTGCPPYPAGSMPQPTYPQQWKPSGYDETGPSYSLIPREAPPPSYSDIVKQ